MTRLFISAPGKMHERWSQAFPEARVVAKISRLSESVLPAKGSLWLDLSTTPADLRPAQVVAAVSKGLPVVAMGGPISCWAASRGPKRLGRWPPRSWRPIGRFL